VATVGRPASYRPGDLGRDRPHGRRGAHPGGRGEPDAAQVRIPDQQAPVRGLGEVISATTFWTWARPLAGVAMLAALVYRFGAEPFLDGLRQTDVGALLVALVVTAVTTACCARRWSRVAERLEVSVPAWDLCW
jgi:hypothetical protein